MARRIRGWAAAAVTGIALSALALALPAGCLDAAGIAGGGAGGGGSFCTTPAQCDDENPCTTDTCSASGECVHAPVMDGPLPPMAQTPGDCKQIQCERGASETVADTSNKPTSSDTCTTGSCNGDTPVSTAEPDGTACDLSGTPGECKDGKCTVGCKVATDCPSKGACQTATCNGAAGTCEYTNVADGTPTPGVTSTPGTCKTHVCLGGVDTDAEDDSNVPTVPAAMAGCADAKCTNGTPSIPLHALDSQCSTWMNTMPGFCDSAGECVQCNETSECLGTSPTNDCQKPQCNANNLCVPQFTASGTPTTTTPAQTPGDCQQVVCDGNGGIMTVTDTMNTPANTDQGCTLGTCTGGTPGTKSAPNGQSCAAGSCAGSMEACLNGMCAGCTQACQCQGGGTEPNGMCTGNACSCTPSTCGGLGLTCGNGIANGCAGNPLDCNTGTIAGQETDVDCGGPTSACATRCAQGMKCKITSDCVGGLTCADGVCCNQACAGACEACTAMLKGQGNDGVCGSVISGNTDPHNICKSQTASTCGDEGGLCNGSGACTTWPSGTQCAAAYCTGDVLTKLESCANGACTAPTPATQNCSPYLCQSNACTTSCNNDAGCVSGYSCTTESGPPSGTCVQKLTQGTACSGSTQCLSGNCVDGFCCNIACNTQCQACSNALTGGVNGTCGNVSGGTPDPANICKSTAQAGCGTDGNCTAGGACEFWGISVVCAAASCSGGMQMRQATCTGGGSCGTMSPTACTPYICGATACKTTCASDSDCIGGDYCTGPGVCEPKLAIGGSCAAPDWCVSNFCVDGYCCNSACNTQCQACSQALTGGTNGTCSNVDVGVTDPSGTCATQPSTTCGTDGKCAAAGDCQYWPAATACTNTTPVSCSNGVQEFSTECDGSGHCDQDSQPTSCGGNFACNGTTCYASCGTTAGNDADCATNYYCDGVGAGACQPQLATGASCSHDYQCMSGMCNGGKCN